MLTKQVIENFHENERISIKGTPGSLLQVMINLITNAIDAMNGKHGGEINIDLSENETHVIISICDQGCGIPDSIRTKIFDPMFTTKPFGESTGLGLTIVQDVINGEYNGHIEIESDMNTGTIFRLYLKKSNEF